MKLPELLPSSPVHELETGILDVPSDVYHNVTRRPDIVRSSGLRAAVRGVAHYAAHFTAAEWAPSDAAKLGTAVHAWLLEPEKWALRAVPPKVDLRTKTGKERLLEWRAAHSTGMWVEPEHDEIVRGIEEAIGHIGVVRHVRESPGLREQTFVFREQALTCVARPDFVSDAGVVVDVKTASDPTPGAFARSIANFRYDLQACHYTNAVAALRGSVTKFCFLVIGSAPPHEVRFFEIEPDSMSVSWGDYQKALDTVKAYRDGRRKLPDQVPLEQLKVRS